VPLRVAFRSLRGGWGAYIELVDAAVERGDRAAARYMDCWLALTPEERRHHTPAQLCARAGVAPGSWYTR
jgi:hypothetical protein